MEGQSQTSLIQCQACGEPATGKIYLCSSPSCLQLGRGRHGGGGRHRGWGPRRFGGGRRGLGRAGVVTGRRFAPLFRPYYGRYYQGFLGNPLWRRYAWYSYYRHFPPYSPFWYLLSLYPPGNPFWDTFGYYPPEDPYWLQYQQVVGGPPYGASTTDHHIDMACHLCGSDDYSGSNHHNVVFGVSTREHGRDTWLMTESQIRHRGAVVAKMTPSLWDALVTQAERMAPQDWSPQAPGESSTGDKVYSMRLSKQQGANDIEYELLPQSDSASDMRALLNTVLSSTQKLRSRGSAVLFNRFTRAPDGSERGTLVTASGHAFRYRLPAGGTLEDKLRAARRIKGLRLSTEALDHMSDIARHLKASTYAVDNNESQSPSQRSTLVVSYASKTPVLVAAKGRLQLHYDAPEDARLSARFSSLYQKLV